MLPPDVITSVFPLDASAEQLNQWRSWLSDVERARASRYVRAEHGTRYIAAHAHLRRLLAERMGCGPGEIVFERGEHGKPRLAGGGWQFNLSHSGGWGLVGLHPMVELGVDIECVAPPRPYLALAKRFFTANEAAYLGSLRAGELPRAFCRLWTCKEAWMKAIGRGLAAGAASVEVSLEDGHPRVVELAHRERTWAVIELPAHPAYAAAVVSLLPGDVRCASGRRLPGSTARPL